MALALHDSINNEDDDEEGCAIVPTKHDAVSDLASFVKVLQKRVIKDCHLYLTMGRGISVNHLLQIIDCSMKTTIALI